VGEGGWGVFEKHIYNVRVAGVLTEICSDFLPVYSNQT